MSAGPDELPLCDGISQWCLPLRRQQAGREFAARAASAELASERPISTNRTMAEMRRKDSCYLTDELLLGRNDAGALADGEEAVRGDAREHFFSAAGPANLQIGKCGRPETEVQTRIVRGIEA